MNVHLKEVNKMKKIRVQEAIGYELFHDITKIIPGEFKGVAFKRGHIIREEDIEELLSIGKDHIYVFDENANVTHENDACKIIKNLTAGDFLKESGIQEGKINVFAEKDGLLKVNKDLLFKVNGLGDIIISTLHNDMPVREGKKVASFKIIPLVIDNEKLNELETLLNGEKIIHIKPFNKLKIGAITTGNEVYYGRIKDKFNPVLKEKADEYNCDFLGQTFCPDDKEKILLAINEWEEKGADMIICTGGMSIDPDDVTPSAIKLSGARIISYGSPVLPGAMFLMSYKGNIPIIGLPGGALFNKRTAFDVIFPKILAGQEITDAYIASLGHGGLCMECPVCVFPSCGFGKN